MSVTNLVLMSNKYGANPEFVLAGGGNTSYKDFENGKIYIKGSGTSLATVKAEEFVILYRDKLAKMWDTSYPDDDTAKEAAVLADMMNARIEGEGSKRPSVETLLHDLMNFKYVLHVHPAIVNGVTCGRDAEKATTEIFDGEAVFVPPTKPGYTLAVFCRNAIDAFKERNKKDPKILVLQNHGIFFADNDTESIDKMVEESVQKIKARIKKSPNFNECEFDRELAANVIPYVRALYGKYTGKISSAKFLFNAEIKNYTENAQNFAPLVKPFSPDHIVYYKAEPLFVEGAADFDAQIENISLGLKKFVDEKKYIPKIIAIEKLGCIALGNTKKECDTAAELFLDAAKIGVYSASFGGFSPLPDDLTDFIVNWEVESYRQKVALSAADEKSLNEKICVVTGAAQGFGREIADYFSKQGANVVYADINSDGINGAAEKVNQAAKVNKAFAVCADVSCEMNIARMIQDAVLEFGGIDVFVNNAGIVRAGSLDEMTLENFDLVTKINYTAYFLCAKYAAQVMKTQFFADNSGFFDIIEINSKSGLEGSDKNFAYAGSKFGGIGLTQSFALELAPFNIKVNAVCPGNFLDGPLWSDPEKGLFVQYLKAGKVAGAKTVEDVRKFYESKVPLRRGCEANDVIKAICYLIDQKYETGQALPVTGGQIMLP